MEPKAVFYIELGSVISIAAKRIKIQKDTKLDLSAYFKCMVYSDKLSKFSHGTKKFTNTKKIFKYYVYRSILKRIPPE